MAKTLIIKGANFLTNKLDTVYFGEVPCTGISIDGTASISVLGGSVTLTPTVTPENTTDQVLWTSSDSSVASVMNGVVTGNNYGTATITATCGNYSDSCVVTVSIDIAYATDYSLYISTFGAHALVDVLLSSADSYFVTVGASQREDIYPASCNNDTGDISDIYPIAIPEGAKSITFVLQGFACVFQFFNSKAKGTSDPQAKIRDSAKVLFGETPNGGTDWSIAAWTYNTRTITIPEIEGIDSFIMSFRANSGYSPSGFDPSNLTVTFNYE